MPFGEPFYSDGDMSPPLIQSDLLDSVEPESPKDSGADVGPTVVTLDDRAGLINEQPGIPEADMDIQNDIAANFLDSAPSSTLKKRGRPSLSGSATPARSAVAKTPRSSKSTATPKSAARSTGKRKAAEPEPEEPEEPEGHESEENEHEDTPAAKRRRPGRAAGASASARLAAKAANKPTRGRPKSTANQTASKPAKKAGRPKKETNGEVAEDEYEVEDIVDSAIDADTMEHMYLVKWKNYPASQNTWEPRKNLKGSLDLVRKFDAKKKKADAEEAAKKVPAKKTTPGRKPRAAKAVKAVKAAKKAPGRPARKRRARA
ncbi:hypothetical protein NEMBOFW57_003308 [Staphylotrichum longicolle]|uniref:Chromo domain-containing protein n=1 Tax=Staphylotrichum longicolle TaxID=669026 RepID=A0AAD4F501_9PEZI|nr:hypothetical protein NEMBOFW57_003308 [Staphylotrichum longicolle]